jgi:adenosine deaminase
VIAKAELHVHLEGTAPPALVRRLAARNGVPVPDGLFASEERFAWRDFLDFLRAYDRAASVIRTAEDYRDVTFAYLRSCAREGAVYVELIASPDHAAAVGLSDAEHFGAIARGIDDAQAAFGIEARILVTAIRDLGAARALQVAELAAARPHPYVVGFNLSGDEASFPPAGFAAAYAVAAGAGVGCTIHAGEWAGAASVREALDLPVTRISHGVRAIEDPGVVAELAARGIVLEVCPTSNVALGVFASYEQHPLPALLEAGVPVTLGSDDPPWFGATLGGEYAIARERFGLDEAALSEITRTAIRAAFADAGLRSVLGETDGVRRR